MDTLPYLSTLQPDNYLSESIFQKDLSLLSKCWQIIGHESMLPCNGDVYAFDLLDVPIFFRRSTVDGQIRAFRNSCPHRGGPIYWPGLSSSKKNRCQYHNWIFSENGNLHKPIGFTTDKSVPFPKERCSLKELPVINNKGFIYTRLLGLLDNNDFADIPKTYSQTISDVLFHSSRKFHANCNWKIYIENWLEGYHISSLHKKLAQEVVSTSYKYKRYKKWLNFSSSTKEGSLYAGFWLMLFPCTAINSYRKGFSIEIIKPISIFYTEISYLFFQLKSSKDTELDAEINATSQITQEDIAACEFVQKNMKCSSFSVGFLSPEKEQGLINFYQLYASATKANLV